MSSIKICRIENKQDRQYMYNITLRHVRAAVVAVRKQ